MSDTLTTEIPTRVVLLEQIARDTRFAFERIEHRLDAMAADHRQDSAQVERRFEQVERRFERMDDKFETTNSRMDSHFRWLLGTIFALAGLMVAGFAALLGVMAHGFHWI